MSVEAEVPAEGVVVVADGGHRVDDEAAGATIFDEPAAVVGVLPEQAVILFVETDRVRDLDDLTLAVR